jgi:dipeptide/tripeptide permease
VYILICIGFACLIGVLYNMFLRASPKITIWVSFGLFIVASGLAGWGCLNQYNTIEDGTGTNSFEGSTIWMILAIVIWSFGGLFIVMFVFNCTRMGQIVELVEVLTPNLDLCLKFSYHRLRTSLFLATTILSW